MKYLATLTGCVLLSSLILVILAESPADDTTELSETNQGVRTKRSDPVLPGLALLGGTGLLLGLGIGHHLHRGHGHRHVTHHKVIQHHHHQGWGWHEPIISHGWGWEEPTYGHGWGWHK